MSGILARSQRVCLLFHWCVLTFYWLFIGEQLLPEVINKFERQYPAMNVSLELTDRQVDLFGESYDLAIRAGKLNQPDLVARKFATLPLVVCVSPSYLARSAKLNRPSDLNMHNCLLNPNIKNPLVWRFVEGGKTLAQRVNSNLQVNSLKVLKRACVEGAGIVYAPRFFFWGYAFKRAVDRNTPRFFIAFNGCVFNVPWEKVFTC